MDHFSFSSPLCDDTCVHLTQVFIVKPDAGAKGRGIFLTSKLENVTSIMQKEIMVAQRWATLLKPSTLEAYAAPPSIALRRYIRHPLLIDGLKFDVRLYVLVTSVEPLRVYLFQVRVRVRVRIRAGIPLLDRELTP